MIHRFLAVLCLGLIPTLTFAENQTMSTQPQVKFTTSLGAFVVTLNAEKAPKTTENFLKYAREGFYDGTIFHRVIPGFMAQGGGFDSSFKQKTTHAPVENEANNGLKNDRGAVAMARTNDPNSATSQFFINYKNNDFLNHTSPTAQGWGYAVFGEVTEGMEVIDAMADAPTGNRGMHQDVPKTDIVIEKAEIIGE